MWRRAAALEKFQGRPFEIVSRRKRAKKRGKRLVVLSNLKFRVALLSW